MLPRVRTQPEIADIVALARALERDEQRPPDELQAREKRLAPDLPAGTENRAALALAWLDAVEAEDEPLRTLHQRAETALQLTGFLIGVAAVILGWGATLAAFYFDGSGRVNSVLVLALLVALPGVMIIPYLFAALPPRIVRGVPGAGAVAALARGFGAGRLARWLWRFFPRDLRDALALVSGRMNKHQQLYTSLQKWAMLRWSQSFAVTFQVTALLACAILVVFTDLAFGWSTTLTSGDAAIDAQRVHRITSAMAVPWTWAFPEAQPSLELIQESRYFRVAAEVVSRGQAARLGDWWKFIVLAIAVYGLLPRLITLAFARARLRAAARAAIAASPGLSAVLRRIHRARVETRAPDAEPGAGPEQPPASEQREPAAGAGRIRAVINWSGVPVGDGVFAAAFPGAPVFEAGGAAAVQDDVALAEKIGAAPEHDQSGDVLIVVKAWEPPLMEFVDFLRTLRAALAGEPSVILVLPVGLDQASELGAGSPSQVKLWRGRLAAVGDPWLRVAATPAEVQA